ncbi:MAG: class I SAM-dependent methyltransferase [Candidatus Omnitrophica bacterium]|nr:class I SAM-dependent methyltransferase [Candidatus Omnitrophota bacterium]
MNADDPRAPLIPIYLCQQCGIIISAAICQSAAQNFPEQNYKNNYYGEAAAGRPLNRLFNALFQTERQQTSLARVKPGKILDVGCGDGTFLSYLPPLWKKFGYEPSPCGQAILKNREGIHFFDLASPEKSAQEQSFDVITLWQSLEHMPDPQNTLNAIKNILKNTGILFISVPNCGSLQAKIFRGRWFHLDPTRHYWHYTPKTITRLLENAGYHVVTIRTLSFEYGVFGWLQSFLNLLPIEINLFYKILKSRKVVRPPSKIVFCIYLAAAVILLPLSLALTLFEALILRGSVLNVKAVLR